jgi:hypothetical protein
MATTLNRRRLAATAAMGVLLNVLLVVTHDASTVSASAVPAAPGQWTKHTIYSGPSGADGVDLADIDDDGLSDVASGWEQAGLVTVSFHPGTAAVRSGEPWYTIAVGKRLHGVEDAIFADVDGDGNTDVIATCECRRVVVYFAPRERARLRDESAWSPVVISGAAPVQRWMKAAFVDIDGDGRRDIVAGGKVSPASIGWFRTPTEPRSTAAWEYTPMSEVAWTMSVRPHDADLDGDNDIVMSDRLPIRYANGTVRYDLRGTRWLENADGGTRWLNHPIGFAAGEHKFLRLVDFDGDRVMDVLDGASGTTYNRTFLRRGTPRWASWPAPVPIPQPAQVGYYQDVNVGDVDLDGDLDLVFSYSHAEGDLSGVVWLSAGSQSWERNEVSGPAGTKYDNVELYDMDGDGDLDAVTSEQIEQLGVIWYENPAREP